ncbi:MFS transporter [Nonomuraea rubra]|uniref:MFS family permease n=1 Tax=Nonomuraea rubra TaxID=46180 RepID=A0A7X0P2A1_9ACTN|nr:MFS transporter [Nonomuraea rubra]MBB6553970.1 MFS family permease [Nonomuraea rubra]
MRALQGVGGAFAFAPSMAIIAASYGDAARTRAIAIFGATTTGAGALGPLAGGVLVESVSWRSMFIINVPLGLLLCWPAARRLPADAARRGPAHVDVAGVITLAAWVSAVTLALLRGEAQGWTSFATLAQAGVGVLGLGAFLVTQARGRRPLLDLSLFRIRSFTGAALVSARAAAKVPLGALAAAGFLVSAAGLGALLLADAGASWVRVLPGLVLLGLGRGLVQNGGTRSRRPPEEIV